MRHARLLLSLVLVAGLGTLLAARPQQAPNATQDTFARLLEDVSAYRGRGFTLPLPEGVLPRYSRRMEDVSERRYQEEADALAGFAERLADIDVSTLPAGTRTDAEILSRQLRNRREELRFRAFEIPIGSRQGFHFALPALPDRYGFDSIRNYDDYIAQLQ